MMEELDAKLFADALDQYEKHYACGEYALARASLREAIMSCPYPTIVRLLKAEYAKYREVSSFNLWAWLKAALSMKRAEDTKVGITTSSL